MLDDGAGATGRTGEVPTSVGRYNPVPYALQGWPSLFLTGDSAVVGMRLAGALLCGVFLAWGLTVLRHGRHGRWAAALGMTAVTPMTVAYAGAVNPSGLEISAAFAFAAGLLGVATGSVAPHHVRSTLLVAAVTGAVLVNVRTSSPLVVLLIGLTALALAGAGRLRRLVALRATRVFVVVNLVAALGAGGWTLIVQPLRSLGGRPVPEYASAALAARDSLLRTERYLQEMIGITGWLDTPVPLVTTLVWTSLTSVLLVLAVARGDRRVRVVVVALTLLVVALPTALQAPDAAQLGLIFQGRYLIPFAVPVVVLAALVVAASDALGPALGSRWVVASLLVAQVAAFAWAVRRYAVGLPGDVGASPSWEPPGGATETVVLFALCSFGGLVLWCLSARRAEEQVRPTAP